MNLQCTLTPEAVLSFDSDAFGNPTAEAILWEPHGSLSLSVAGTVQAGIDCREPADPDPLAYAVFRVPSSLTAPGEAIRHFHQSLDLSHKDNEEKCHIIMHRLWDMMHYAPASTTVSTTAEEAFRQGQGVCQDYAHIMLSLCRLEKIPARYVVGLIPGEGVTHAWVEALCGGYWHSFDPTNNHTSTGEYIKFSHGRDYKDCLVVSGFFTGASQQAQNIHATVDEQQ